MDHVLDVKEGAIEILGMIFIYRLLSIAADDVFIGETLQIASDDLLVDLRMRKIWFRRLPGLTHFIICMRNGELISHFAVRGKQTNLQQPVCDETCEDARRHSERYSACGLRLAGFPGHLMVLGLGIWYKGSA